MINQSCRYLMLIENHICCNGNDKQVEIYLQYLYHSCSSFSVLDSPELLGFILCVISSYSARLDSAFSIEFSAAFFLFFFFPHFTRISGDN